MLAAMLTMVFVICIANVCFAQNEFTDEMLLGKVRDAFEKEDMSSFIGDSMPVELTEDGSVRFVIERDVAYKARSSESTFKETAYVLLTPVTEEAKQRFATIMNARTGQQSPYSDWDTSGAVLMTTTILWENRDNLGPKGEMMRMLAVKGELQAPGSGSNVGSGISIVGNSIEYGAWGAGVDPIIVQQSKTYTMDNAKRSFFIAFTSNWVYTSYGQLGIWWKLTLSRGGSSWLTEYHNAVPLEFI